MKSLFGLAFLVTLVVVLSSGCSGGGASIVTPPGLSGETVAIPDINPGGRILFGVWRFELNVSEGVITIEPVRNAQGRYDVTSFLLLPVCNDCIELAVLELNMAEKFARIDVTLSNKTSLSAYDVRAILLSDDENLYLNAPDAYTDLWDNGGPVSINPFVTFATDQGHHKIIPGADHSRTVKIGFPTFADLVSAEFIIDASWPKNCAEPYEFHHHIDHITLFNDPGASVELRVLPYDWQDDVYSIALIAQEVTDEEFLYFTPESSTDYWAVDLSNTAGAPIGEYDGWIAAWSPDAESPALYDRVVISIKENNGWASTWGGSWPEQGNAVTTDDEGNVYTAGYFADIVDFDPGDGELLLDAHHYDGGDDVTDAFLCKYNSTGELQWAANWGGDGDDQANAVAFDGLNSIYVTGFFTNVADFDPGPLEEIYTSPGKNAAFLSKFNTSGEFQWARTWKPVSTSGYAEGLSLAVNELGEIFTAGIFDGIVDFDPGPPAEELSGMGGNAFVSKFDADGEFQWAGAWGGIGYDCATGVALDDSSIVYICGFFESNVDFDPTDGEDMHAASYGRDSFLVKLNSDGGYVWGIDWGGYSVDSARSVAVDSSGAAYVVGYFMYTCDFEPGPGVTEYESTDQFHYDVFLSKYASDGGFEWAGVWGNDSHNYGRGVVEDGAGGIIVLGQSVSSIDFDPGPDEDIPGYYGGSDIFISKFDADGDYQWVSNWGGPSGDYPYGIALDGSGNIFITGRFEGTTDFNPGTGVEEHTSLGLYDIFLCKVNEYGGW